MFTSNWQDSTPKGLRKSPCILGKSSFNPEVYLFITSSPYIKTSTLPNLLLRQDTVISLSEGKAFERRLIAFSPPTVSPETRSIIRDSNQQLIYSSHLRIQSTGKKHDPTCPTLYSSSLYCEHAQLHYITNYLQEQNPGLHSFLQKLVKDDSIELSLPFHPLLQFWIELLPPLHLWLAKLQGYGDPFIRVTPQILHLLIFMLLHWRCV